MAQDSHWKNNGIFVDQERWLNIGRQHLELIKQYASQLGLQFPVKLIIEWGCGGGANAVHFVPLTEKFIGIDINRESLIESEKQVKEIGYQNFESILINATNPEAIATNNITNADLFICTYVYELFPSPEYGLRILKLANSMLKLGGVAFIHIRYNDGNKELQSKKMNYNQHPYIMTTYKLEEFWKDCVNYGFEPLGIYLTPVQPLVNDSSTAYYFLIKKEVYLFDCLKFANPAADPK